MQYNKIKLTIKKLNNAHLKKNSFTRKSRKEVKGIKWSTDLDIHKIKQIMET